MLVHFALVRLEGTTSLGVNLVAMISQWICRWAPVIFGRYELRFRVLLSLPFAVMAMSKTTSVLAPSVLPVAMTGCSGEASNPCVDFNVFLPSGRFAIISCLSTETLKNLQLQIAALLGLKAARPLCDGIPLLSFFQPSFNSFSNSLLHLDTLAAELQGCSVQVLQHEHPDWCRQKCFFRHSPALDWDIEEEVRESLWLFSNGQFRYLRQRFFWNDAVHTEPVLPRCRPGEVDREELEAVGHWRCALLEGTEGTGGNENFIHFIPDEGSSLEEVVMLEGTSKTLHQSSQDDIQLQRKIRLTFSKVMLLENYEHFFVDPLSVLSSEFSATCAGSNF
eukprot:Skav207593  [mRNA]  locus=scaffold2450:101590:102594:+ [translate_table: standard]